MEFVESLKLVASILGAVGTIGGFAWLVYRKAVAPIVRAVMAIANVIERELSPNGGGSLVDQVKGMKGDIAALKCDLTAIKEAMVEKEKARSRS